MQSNPPPIRVRWSIDDAAGPIKAFPTPTAGAGEKWLLEPLGEFSSVWAADEAAGKLGWVVVNRLAFNPVLGKYRVRYSGVDGNSTSTFTTLADAATYVRDRYLGPEYMRGNDTLQLEFGTLEMRGFTFHDVGVRTWNPGGWFDFTWSEPAELVRIDTFCGRGMSETHYLARDDDALANGSFYRVRRGKVSHYMNGDFVALVDKPAEGLKRYTVRQARALLPKGVR